jgi:hemolysin activation/secretion protein
MHPTLLLALLLETILFSLTVMVPPASAQSNPSPGVTIPPGAPDAVQESLPQPSERTPPLPGLSPAAPPAPTLEVPPTAPSQGSPDLRIRFPVKRIDVEGNTVLQQEIAALVAEYEQRRELSFEELLELRSRITQLYVNRGYITSGAFLPNNQLLRDGVIRIQVVEGTVERIDLCLLSPQGEPPTRQAQEAAPQNGCGSAHLQDGYVRSRLAQAATRPVSQPRIERALQLLQLNPLIQQVNAELTAGSAPGLNILSVRVREAPAFHAGIGGDNYQSPSIGSGQLSVQASHDDVLGIGDRINAGYGRTEGLDSYDVGYAIPVNPQDGTVSFRYSRDESRIVEARFRRLGIRSDSETFSLGFRQPIIQEPETELAVGLQLDLRRSTTFLDGQPFSFSLGPDNGRSNVTVIRLSQDWVDRSARRVLAARSQFSVGLDAVDATVNNTGTDGRFFSWLGQFQWVQRLSRRWVLVSRINAQLTPDSLLPLERFGYGGVDTVRGYEQNQLVTDSGILSSIEARFSPLSDLDQLQLIPFIEGGYGWNNQFPDPDRAAIASVGLGIRWAITPALSIRVDYGIPLVDVNNRGNSLQDDGLFFSVRYQPF